jgi:putative flippase GtrA
VSSFIEIRVFRFVIAGGGSFLVEYMAFWAVLHTAPLLVANALSFGCGLVSSFLLNKQWVFKPQGSANTTRIAQFIVVATINLIVSTVSISLISMATGSEFLAKALTMMIVAIWNYTIFARLVFADR